MMRTIRNVALSLAALLGGILLLVFGVNQLTSSDVRCGNSTISSSEQCFSSVRSGRWGRTTQIQSYAEQNESNRRAGIGYILGGTVLVLAGAGIGVSTLRSKPTSS